MRKGEKGSEAPHKGSIVGSLGRWGLTPIQFSPNVGLATVITACQPTEGSAHGTSGSRAGRTGRGVEEEGSSQWRPGEQGPGDEGLQCGAVTVYMCMCVAWKTLTVTFVCVRVQGQGLLVAFPV